MQFSDYCQYDALGLADLVRRGEVSAHELLAVAAAKAVEFNPQLNCFVHTFLDAARQRIDRGLPEGPFSGVPFVLKDLLDDLMGQPTAMGTRAVKWMPQVNAESVNRYLAAGLVPFAKSATPELGAMITTEPEATGPVHNPWQSGISPGGSSGGSAAAVASRIVPMASAGDGGGSIRFPAAACGLFGLKPSRGRSATGPAEADGWGGAVALHPLTLSVRDSAAMLDCLAGPEPAAPFAMPLLEKSFLSQLDGPLKKLRIGFSCAPMIPAKVQPEAVAAMEHTLGLLEDLGHDVHEAAPEIDPESLWRDFVVVMCGHVARDVEWIREQFGRDAAAQVEPSTMSLHMLGRSFSSLDVARARVGWSKARVAMARYFESSDLLLTPTLVKAPDPHGVITPTPFEASQMRLGRHLPIGKLLMSSGLLFKLSERLLSRMAFTLLANVTGLPAMSVPLYWTSGGLPLGSQYVGPMGHELRLLQLARQLEQASPWFDRRPPICNQ